MSNYHRQTISRKGLRLHMESQGLDYVLFIKLVDNKIPITNICKLIGKSRPTIEKYIKVYRLEQDNV